MTLNWADIRSLHGSQAKAFEELCAQLARTETPAGSTFFRKGTPDGGVECFSVLSDGNEWGWQAKYFTMLGDSQFDQLDKSVRTALARHPSLARYFVCVPLDRPDARTEGRKSALERWTEHVSKWEGWAHAQGSGQTIEFVWWGSSELLERLSRSEHCGRVFFWFSQRHFDSSWFNARLDEAILAAGPRYTPPVHVDLPIARDLDCFGRTNSSINAIKAQAKRVRKAVQMVDRAASNDDDPSRNVPTERLLCAVNAVLQGLSELAPDPVAELPFRRISERVCEAESAADEYNKLLSQHAREYDTQQAKRRHRRPDRWNPYNERLHRVYRLQGELRDAQEAADHAHEIANRHLMVLSGDAGTGKTHLLCDIAIRRVDASAPTVLLMGQRFVSAEAPWPQALQQLDLQGITAEQFVGALEAAAQAAHCRALLIIDAVNEGQGRTVWPPHLAAFLAPLEKSPWIGVLLSVRSTYEHVVIPEEVRGRAAAAVHRGFADHEYDATRTFFSHYGLELPSTPILQLEFRNPLFLKTVCSGLRDEGERKLPRGFHGISAAFDLYLRATNNRLATALGYNSRDELVRKALGRIAQLLVKNGERWLTRSVAAATVDELLPGREYERSLYRGLVSEGVLVEEMTRSTENKQGEIVFISYDRYADHAIADLLLRTHLNTASPAAAFDKGGGLAFLQEEGRYIASGLIEALCIQVPERTGREFITLAPAVAARWGTKDAFRQSLVWRKLDAFSKESLDVLNELRETRHDNDDTLDVLLSVATLKDHPFNAEFLDRLLRRSSMPDRDAWWSIYLHHAWGTHGAVDRIVDWASDVSPGTDLDDRVDELCSIVLAWMLTTSNRFLRDRATKSLVSLLTGRLTTAARLVERFADVNDPYVLERLYAVAYGVVMRSSTPEEVGAIAAKVYECVFADGRPPAHILLRDYARGIIERALHLRSKIDVDPRLIRPPYSSTWPDIPSEAEIEPYLADWSRGAHNNGDVAWSRNRISRSVMDDDFAFYVIGTNHGWTNWLSLRLDEPPWRSYEARMEKLLPTLSGASQQAWDRYKDAESSLDQEELAQRLQSVTQASGREPEDVFGANDQLQPSTADPPGVSEAKTALLAALEDFRNSLTADQKREVDSIPSRRRAGGREYPPRFDLKLIQRYVLKRVFELGWTTERFGQFDEFDIRSYGSHPREASKPERIGKKYQWIGYHEILAHIADRYQHREHREDEGDQTYQGPWQMFRRDIDPSITFLSKQGGTSWDGHGPSWWAQERYAAWRDGDSARDWMVREEDIPNVTGLLAARNPHTGTAWLNLHTYLNWRQPHPSDVESSDVDRRDLWLLLTGYFVRAGDAEAFMAWAKGVDFMDRWMPDPPKIHGMFFGEYGWSPAFRYFNQPYHGLNTWVQLDHGCPVTVRPAAVECSCRLSDFDCSLKEEYALQVPHWDVLEQLELKWTGRDAEFVDSESNLAVLDPTARDAGPTALLTRDDLVRRYLSESNMALCWTVHGEKRIIGGESRKNCQGALHISGAYILRDQEPKGFLNFHRHWIG